MLPIQKKHIVYNYSNSGTPKKYIVIHDTANTGKGADDEAHYKYFNGGVRDASAHYFVATNSITETVDPKLDSWHCGDGYGKYGITNANSIGVEICINSDGNYAQTVKNAVELVKHLMSVHNIPVSNVVRHYDASRKTCPGTMAANNWAKWNEFKAALTANVSAPVTPKPTTPTTTAQYGTVTADVLNVRRTATAKDSSNIIGQLKYGEKVKIGLVQGDWINIYYGDHGGWVSAQYMNLNSSEPTDLKGRMGVAVNLEGAGIYLMVRDKASTNCNEIGRILNGEQVKIWGKVGNYYSIYFGDHGGYVTASYIKLI